MIGHRFRSAVRAAVTGAVVALGGCTGVAPAATPALVSPSDVAGPSCELRIVRDERGPGARVHGTGYEPDTTVVLTITDRSGITTFREDEMPALRTDVRGVFILPIQAEPGDIGVAIFEATAGDCSARASTEVTAAMFGSDCPVAGPAGSGGEESAAYAALVLDDRPLHYWRFEEADGELAAAATGEAATYRGDPTLARPGVFAGSRAVGLDGLDDWIDIADVELSSDLTIEAWVFLCGSSIGNEDGIVGQAGPGPDVNLFEERLRLFDGQGDPAVASRAIDAGRWVHVAVVRLGDAVTLFMDGAQVGAGRYEPAFPVAAIGWGNAGFFQGAIDEVAIYDHAVTAERLGEHATAGSP